MRKLTTAIIVTVMAIGFALGLVACGSSSSTTAATGSSANTASSSAATTSSSEASQDASLPEKNGFDETTNTTVEIQGVNFQLPSYFEDGSTSDDTKRYKLKMDDGSDDLGMAMFYIFDGKASSAEQFEANVDNAILLPFDYLKMYSDVKIQSHDDGKIAGLPSAIYTLTGKATSGQSTLPFTAKACIYLNSSLNYAVAYFVQLDGAKFDYTSDFNKILSTATEVEQPATSADGVSADLKEMLDSYEAFMDDYIAFMQKYKNAGAADLASMMADYSTYLQRYSEFTQKVEALDSSTMSNADAAYYIEVTSRVSQKLLNAAV